MNRFFFLVIAVAGMLAWGLSVPAQASQHIWYVTSPNHGQTYAYGSETRREWTVLGSDRHLALYATFSNEPFAQGGNRRYDDFTFNFPQATLGPDGATFFYHAAKGLNLPVAAKRNGFLGIQQINLLPTSYLIVKKQHGYLTLTLAISDRPFEPNPNIDISIEH